MISRRTFSRLALGGLGGPLLAPSALLAQYRQDWVERTLARLDLRARVGQLMMPMLQDLQDARILVERYGVGGFVCFRGEAAGFARQLNELQSISRIPLLMSADFERGAGAYIDGATDLPIAMALGAAAQSDLAYQAGTITALEARALGVHVVFAPVLDVNNNPNNPIINVRSFGQSPALVSEMAAAYVKGLQDHGALATIKHFPGHGNTGTDSHLDLATVSASRRELEQTELLPFRNVLKSAEPRGVMAAHLWVQALDAQPVPSSLSVRVISGLLRRELGYRDLIYTDSMGMGGVLNYTNGDHAKAQVLALAAGCDVLVMPTRSSPSGEYSALLGVEAGTKAILDALKRGTLDAGQIERSVRRVLDAKARLELDRRVAVDIGAVNGVLADPTHRQVAERIARRALTLVRGGSLLPLGPNQRIGVLTLTNREGAGAFGRDSLEFVPALRAYRTFETVNWSLKPTPSELEAALQLARGSDVIVVAAYLKVFVGTDSGDIPATQRAALRNLHAANPKIVFVSFGSPYALAALPELPVLICAYDDSRASQITAARALTVNEPWTGQLPVRI